MNGVKRGLTTIALVNQKGGCGKTTTSVSLASCLAANGGLRTVIVDLDPQCNATTSFGLDLDDLKRAGKHTVADMFLAGRAGIDCTVPLDGRFGDRLAVIPGHRGMSSVHHRLEVEVQAHVAGQGQSDLEADDLRNQNRFKLKSQLETLANEFDVCVIDTPPDLGFILTAALIASTHYIIPVKPSGYDLSGLDSLSKTLRRVKERLNPSLKCLGVLPTMVDQRAKLDREIRGYLEDLFGKDLVFEMDIDSAVAHRQCTVSGQTIIELEPGSKSAKQYVGFTEEVLARLGVGEGPGVELIPKAPPERHQASESDGPSAMEPEELKEVGNG